MELKNNIGPMNRKQVDELFEAEAVFFDSFEVVPEYRLVELFGDFPIWQRWLCIQDDSLERGRDYTVCSPHGLIVYSKSGFYKIITGINYELMRRAHQHSVAGKLIAGIDAWFDRKRANVVKLPTAEAELHEVERNASERRSG